ncbi:hypothetical protein [Rhizorhabdus histidinilytica]|uniref:Uncharacterized protein n=1 Tax=Rhizorhabdus histidinilytica TaxID=439228 RepID=A0A1T5BPY5_9SPHN|nr:hypothetical protein [Rhizorhabdus histidinilytica]SKB49288.1 hypothetical protein SAMN06295920_103188 [Rhizorhabdus histidinilytica]
MGARRGPAFFPAWTHTVGAMKAARDEKPDHFGVRVSCDTCREGRDVDLDAIITKKGADFSLVNRRARCKLTRGCRGWNRFFYQGGVMRPLWTQEQVEKWMRADTARRSAEKLGREKVVPLLHGRDFRLDPPPRGIDQLLWAVCTDEERRELIRRRPR